MKEEILKKVKDICKKEGCVCPEDNIIFSEIANTPLYLREYFRLQKGEKDDNKK